MDESASSGRGAAIYSPWILALYDAWVLGISNRFAWQCSTGNVLLPFFEQHLGARHLDVGVGTGYYLGKARIPASTHVTLMDLNENSLRAAAARSGMKVTTICHDVFQALPDSVPGPFDSISMFYLLHCLPGTMADKEAAIAHLKPALAPHGTLYGATILGDAANHNGFGRRLMAVYNRKGIFGNRADSVESLEAMLKRHFASVEVRRCGQVALFAARGH